MTDLRGLIGQVKQTIIDNNIAIKQSIVDLYINEYTNALKKNIIMPKKRIDVTDIPLSLARENVCEELQTYAAKLLTAKGYTNFHIPSTGTRNSYTVCDIEIN